MKVLLCTPIDDGKNIHTGGIAIWARNFKSYYDSLCDKQGVEIRIVPSNRCSSGGEQNIIVRLYRAIKDYSQIVHSVQKILKKEQFDVVHICSSASLGLIRDLIEIKIAKQQSASAVIHFRFGRIPELSKKKNWEWKLICRVAKNADKLIVIDQASFRALTSSGINNVEYLPNPLSPKTVEVISSIEDVKSVPNRLVFTGHVIPTKGIFELVQACRRFKDVELMFIGAISDTMRKQLIEQAGEEFAPRVVIKGQLAYPDTIKMMKSANVFVLPTYTEGFPNVILEAMACGCPIVATDVGAIPEMLDIENGDNHGICVKPKDVEGLKSAIQKMLDDKVYATQCGFNAQKRVNELYSMPMVWNQMVEIWKNTNN